MYSPALEDHSWAYAWHSIRRWADSVIYYENYEQNCLLKLWLKYCSGYKC